MFQPETISRRQALVKSARCWCCAAVLALAGPALPGLAEAPPANTNWIFEATNHLGRWVWETNTLDKQTCRFWKAFAIPRDQKISRATVRITADNAYTLFLDGHEIGRGSDWRTVTEYDVTRLLSTGRHILAVEAFNDRLQAGFIFGLDIQLADEERTAIEILSDADWRVVPEKERHWAGRNTAPPSWHHALVVGSIGQPPWQNWPYGITVVPPLLPIQFRFWQSGWFQLTLATVCALALLVCLWAMSQLSLQRRSQRLWQAERVRIARDIHDDLGAQLTQLVLLGEVAQREQPEHSAAQTQFTQICALARELSHGMDEVVWAVNARRDTLRDFASYVCKYAQVFLDATPIRCRLDVEPELPATMFDLPLRRNLFLAVKEALNNAAKHSGAGELFLRIHRAGDKLVVMVEDNGRGFDPEQWGGPACGTAARAAPATPLFIPRAERNGMANMTQRMSEISGVCELWSAPGGGCRVVFTVPLENAPRRAWFNWLRRPPRALKVTSDE